VVIGNEANGITPVTAAACDRRITIPMAGRAESLNAAAAACILIWEMTERGAL
jgi:TrmH family RNA methyltransferase